MMALWRLTVGFQPEIVPSSVSKRNTDGAGAVPCETTKPVVPLKTVPVGVPGPETEGIVTTRGVLVGNGWPWPLYNVETPAPLSDIQKGLVELSEIPQGLTKCGSVKAARPGMSETRLVCW